MKMSNIIDTNLFLSSVQQDKRTPTNTIGKDTFLKLLMAQLQNQDPLNPLEDKDFIAQMATFTSVEQLMDMKESLNSLLQAEKNDQQVNYLQLIGKEVLWHKVSYNEEKEPIIEEGKGVISTISFAEDTPRFYLEDGTELSPSNVSEVHNDSYEQTIVQASYLIGKQVSWKKDGIEASGTVQSVIRKDGAIYFQLDDEDRTVLSPEDIISVTNQP
ncbi:flagellar hook assembly protein FlgD [Fervidibacillus halotolerans]|uniref:Basal-body rod modification protein FlgD n=1 Tax=Fervidibacillus halotolerans TaxID=2980027 RepID=A0A9E8M188_9BACI|nr:flagellar hook assembly protein FlgD [Fervidibacillus halotolerans]WAA13600.1 flagellar hook assembly protein FlgD [Fervidibacillus halotolerans]